MALPVQYWVVRRDNGKIILLREDSGIVSMWNGSEWLAAQEAIDYIYGGDTLDTWDVEDVEAVKAEFATWVGTQRQQQKS